MNVEFRRISEQANNVKRQRLLEEEFHSLPESERRGLLEKLYKTLEVPEAPVPAHDAIGRKDYTTADVLKLCQETLSEADWPLLASVDLARVEIKDKNPHARKAAKSGLRQTPQKPGTPSMLFYKLFEEKNRPFSKGKPLYGSVWEGRRKATNIVLIGPSGCGKTRKILELLVRKFGYYLVPRSGSGEDRNYGSRALYEALDLINLKRISSVDLWSKSNEKFDERREVAEFSVKCVLLSYSMIYSTWNKWMQMNERKLVSPKAWLLVQLFPTHFFKRDLFWELTSALMRSLPLHFVFPSMLFPNNFVCTIDEAQVWGEHLDGYFLSAIPNKEQPNHPVLSPLLRAANEVLGTNVILSGTGLSMLKATIWNSLVSNMATTNDTADQYIFCDFQPLTSWDALAHLKDLVHCNTTTDLEHVASWLAGRPRFLATFIEEVIANSHDVNTFIDTYVLKMTKSSLSRTPASHLARLANEPAELKLGGERAMNLYARFILNTYWMSNGLYKLTDANASLVELGLSYASTIAGGQPPYIDSTLVAEPLLLEAARHRRHSLDEVAVDILLDSLTASDQGKRIEYVVADKLSFQLFGGSPLCDVNWLRQSPACPQVLNEPWVAPEWLAGQIAITEPDDTTETRKGFYKWMKYALDPSKTIIRVRFPSNSAGPDIVFVVYNKERTKTLPVFVQVKLKKDVDGDDALLRVDPSLLHHQSRGTQPKIIKAVHGLHMNIMAQLKFPVLRIVVSSKKADPGMPKIRLVPFTRGGHTGNDLAVFLDKEENEQVFGIKLTALINLL